METQVITPAPTKEQDLGVSRSGRIRKKSSKLLDFQSPDELEKKTSKRGAKPIRGGIRGRPSAAAIKARQITESDIEDDDDDVVESEEEEDEDVEPLVETPRNNSTSSTHPPDSEDEIDELVQDLVEGVEAEAENANVGESKVRQSLYMTEKANKRKILKDGKVITKKLERKDKGKSRFTAYSLWAREFRKTSKFSKNQDLDFSNAARRLGELWANVSNKEKTAWRRKAKIQATKTRARDKQVEVNKAVITNSGAFLNRATTSRTRKLAVERQKTPPTIKPQPEPISITKRKRNNSQRSNQSGVTTASEANVKNGVMANSNAYKIADTSNSHASIAVNKSFVSTEPIDAAAHLKLLGESLTIIGERLKEHEGQIAVSGSLSVLLDTLLCSMGPLLCLTKCIPGMEKDPQLSANLETTMDNISYIMPGL